MRYTLALTALCAALHAPITNAQDPWTRLGTDLVGPNAFHGMGLALEGGTLMAGAPYNVSGDPPSRFNPSNLSPPGALLVYTEGPAGWSLHQHFQPSASCPSDRFGMAIVLDGDLAFISAPGAIVNNVRSGAVFRLERVQGAWVERQVLVSSQPQDLAGFGNHIAYDGQRLVVGAPFHTDAGILEWGRGFVFERQGSAWVETAVLVPPPMPPEAWVGYRVAIEGDRAALGVYGDRTDGDGAGAICVFEHDAQGWSTMQQVRPSLPVEWAHFSFSLEMRGDLLIAGSFRGGPAGDHHGTVHVFRSGPTGYSETQRLAPPGLEYGAAFGECASFADDGRLLVGMPGADQVAGRIAIYAPSPSGEFVLESVQWPPDTQFIDCFGWKVHGHGGRIAATAAVAHHNGVRRGVVQVWEPARVGYETPRCTAHAGAGPRPVRLRARGRIEASGSALELVASELPAGALTVLAVGHPLGTAGPSWGCVGGPLRRASLVSAADAAGVCTWSLAGSPALQGMLAGSTWTFISASVSGGSRFDSNGLELRFQP